LIPKSMPTTWFMAGKGSGWGISIRMDTFSPLSKAKRSLINWEAITVCVVGGPRISQELAKELGYDAGFGPGTFAGDVASYLVWRYQQKPEK